MLQNLVNLKAVVLYASLLASVCQLFSDHCADAIALYL